MAVLGHPTFLQLFVAKKLGEQLTASLILTDQPLVFHVAPRLIDIEN